MSESSFIITGEDNIKFFTGIQVASALALEMTTGLKISNRGSAIDAAKIQGFIPRDKRTTRKKALEAVVAELKRRRPDYEPSTSVKRALGL
jgi:hypothetical protein